MNLTMGSKYTNLLMRTYCFVTNSPAMIPLWVMNGFLNMSYFLLASAIGILTFIGLLAAGMNPLFSFVQSVIFPVLIPILCLFLQIVTLMTMVSATCLCLVELILYLRGVEDPSGIPIIQRITQATGLRMGVPTHVAHRPSGEGVTYNMYNLEVHTGPATGPVR